jgi:murein tripeptide amidase MpaA
MAVQVPVFVCALIVTVAHAASLVPTGSVSGWLTLVQLEETLQLFAVTRPDLVKAPFSIGVSIEGRQLWATCIGACDDASATELLITGMHHAREPLGMHAALTFVDWLLASEAGGSTAVAAHLARTAIWVVPCVNPDGYAINLAHFPRQIMARKNRRRSCTRLGPGAEEQASHGHRRASAQAA